MVIPHQLPWHGQILARSVRTLIQLIARTHRFELDATAEPDLYRSSQPLIFCIWHNRLAFSPIVYDRYIRQVQPHRQLAAMVSASKDGALLARILDHFQVQPVRGSTSRRGPQALLELTTWAERGCDLAITPDGPKGPPYKVQDGIIAIAQLTSFPILPVTYSLSRKTELKSWDKFQVPLPFGQCRIVVGKALRVPRDASDDHREQLRQSLESEMRRITPETNPAPKSILT